MINELAIQEAQAVEELSAIQLDDLRAIIHGDHVGRGSVVRYPYEIKNRHVDSDVQTQLRSMEARDLKALGQKLETMLQRNFSFQEVRSQCSVVNRLCS